MSFFKRSDISTYREIVSKQTEALSSNPTIEGLVRNATLATNSHSTQPWRFQISHKTVTVSPDVSCRTNIVDPNDHHLFVSLRCVVENLLIAARALATKYRLFTGCSGNPVLPEWLGKLVFGLAFRASSENDTPQSDTFGCGRRRVYRGQSRPFAHVRKAFGARRPLIVNQG